MQWWEVFVQFFRFSHREIWGVKILFCCMMIVFSFPALLRFIAPEVPEVPLAVQAELEAFFKERRQLVDEDEAEAAPVEYFTFDPNTLNQEGWLRLGFTERQATMILNYRARGGRFFRKEDLQRIYAIDERDYQRIAPYVVIASKTEEASVPRQSRQQARVGETKVDESVPEDVVSERDWTPVERPAAVLMIELNTADSLRLQLLPGIGPAFASRIVRYRDRLGGFHAIDQLLDVYGMDAQRLSQLAPHVWVDPAGAKGLRINEADLETVGRHPLIGFKLGGILLRYRDHHGPYQSLDDIRNLGIFDEEQLLKLSPYLLF